MGDGGLGVARISRAAPHEARHNITDLTFDNESEEHILNEEDLRLEHIQRATSEQQGKDIIVVTDQFNAKSEHRSNAQSKE